MARRTRIGGWRSRQRLGRKLTLEQLEDRQLLAVFTVTNLDDGPVAAEGDAPGTLRQAIFDANATPAADTIEFAAHLSGAVELTEVGDTTVGASALAISTPITIRGNLAGITIARGAEAPEMRLFYVSAAGHLKLETITLKGGVARGEDGTIESPEGLIGRGGAIYNLGLTEIIASTLHDNHALGGNAAPGGNGGSGRGGAVCNDGGTVSIVNSTLSANTAITGSGASPISSFGAGAYTRNGHIEIFNSTITNSTASAGRGVFVIGDDGSASAEIHSSIIAQSDLIQTDLVATFDAGGEISVTGSRNIIRRLNDFDFLTTFDLRVDPELAPLGHNGGPTQTHALQPTSPALDQGTNVRTLGTDQRGGANVRVAGGVADIGAFERQVVEPPALPGDYNRNNVVDAADYVLWRYARGTHVTEYSSADGDGNGFVDDDDYAVWAANFGRELAETAAPAAPSAADAIASEPRPSKTSSPVGIFAGEAMFSRQSTGAMRASRATELPFSQPARLESVLLRAIDALRGRRGAKFETVDLGAKFSRPDGRRDAPAPVANLVDEVWADWPPAL